MSLRNAGSRRSTRAYRTSANSSGRAALKSSPSPCDQFGHQEPGSDAEISAFCERTYGVTFPLFAKIEVNGNNAHPLYVWLKQQKGGLLGDGIKWNFTKFLVDRSGAVRSRFAPMTTPEKLAGDVAGLL